MFLTFLSLYLSPVTLKLNSETKLIDLHNSERDYFVLCQDRQF